MNAKLFELSPELLKQRFTAKELAQWWGDSKMKEFFLEDGGRIPERQLPGMLEDVRAKSYALGLLITNSELTLAQDTPMAFVRANQPCLKITDALAEWSASASPDAQQYRKQVRVLLGNLAGITECYVIRGNPKSPIGLLVVYGNPEQVSVCSCSWLNRDEVLFESSLSWENALKSVASLCELALKKKGLFSKKHLQDKAIAAMRMTLQGAFQTIQKSVSKAFDSAVGVTADGKRITCADVVGVYDRNSLRLYAPEHFRTQKIRLVDEPAYGTESYQIDTLLHLMVAGAAQGSRWIQRCHDINTSGAGELKVFLTPREFCQSVPDTLWVPKSKR